MCKESYVTPELLSELNEMLTPSVPDKFFDDFSGELTSVLHGTDPEEVSGYNITLKKMTLEEHDDMLRSNSIEKRTAYLKNLRRNPKTSTPQGFTGLE